MDLAAGCMGGGGGAIFIIGGNGSTISACKTVSRIWPVFGPTILIDNLGVHVVKRYMTIARSIHTLHPSEPIIRLQ